MSELVWRHLIKRMYDECGTSKAEDFIRRVKAGEHDVPSPWSDSFKKNDGSWVCNQCNSPEYSGSVSEDDLDDDGMSCSNCGGTEFH